MMFEIKLTKISQNQNALRTIEVNGSCIDLPSIGKSFRMMASPLDPKAAMRLVTTSEVQEILENSEGHMVFRTLNTVYKIDYQRGAL